MSPSPRIPVADTWFTSMVVEPGVTMIREPHVNVLLQANMFLIEGVEFDLLVDSGMGISPLKPFVNSLRPSPTKPLVNLLTHNHSDHMGSAHEFDEVWIHPLEAPGLETPDAASLFSKNRTTENKRRLEEFGYPPLPDVLIEARPTADYDPKTYLLKGVKPTRLIEETETINLGDRVFDVMVFGGHSPAGIALFDRSNGTLFSGDAIYDGPLIYDGDDHSRLAYLACLKRLRGLAVSIVHGGHDPSFGCEKMHQICERYIAAWT